MKEVKAIVKFFLNEDNMEYLLKGNRIDNLKEIHHNLFTNIKTNGGCIYIYEPRAKDPNHPNNKFTNIAYKHIPTTEFPDDSDQIVAKVLRYIDNDSLEIEIINSLYYHKLREPCIKLNGYYSTSEDGSLHIEKITRITLGDRNT